jgi:signal transduction histidine kinase
MDKQFRRMVIGAHYLIAMASVFTISSRILSPDDSYASTKILLGVYAMGILVLIVEYRIRKNEIDRSLYTAIDVKKRYARSIDEEVRLPLSMALLDVRVLKDRLQGTDADTIGVLDDLQGNFTTVSNIAGAFLQLDVLDLMDQRSLAALPRKEMVPAVAFFQECVAQSSHQATKKKITLTFRTDQLKKIGLPEDNTGPNVISAVLSDVKDVKDASLTRWNYKVCDEVTITFLTAIILPYN